ncbi:hypothetical protein B4168_0267 [Anoxybacillus flavithermus]|nr:hypothetical protein B4168_0267 [Anoxybacillus flavithermus]OAO88819.1 hypothetical protein GT23_0059 [Parageobacillus thermoglucosidasius]
MEKTLEELALSLREERSDAVLKGFALLTVEDNSANSFDGR